MNLIAKARTKKTVLALLLVLAIAIYLNFFSLSSIGLWHDEAFSVLLIKYDFREMMYRIGLDVHPPLYYIILKAWSFILGNSLFSLRAFSAVAGILSVAASYLFVKQIFKKKKFAIISAALIAFNCFQIQYAREGRMYALGTFFIILSSYFLLKALESKRWTHWLIYAFVASCGIYTHYYVFFSIAAQGLFALLVVFKESKFNCLKWLKNKDLQFSIMAYGLISLSYIPWLNIFLRQIKQVQEAYWIPAMNIWSIPSTLFKMTTGTSINMPKFWYVLAGLMIVIIGAIICSLKKYKAANKWLIFLLLVIPFLGATALSFKTAIYLDRYFIFVLPFYLILMAGAMCAVKNKMARNTIISIAILGSIITFPIHWNNLDIGQKPGMAETAAYLNQEVKPEQKIYVGSSFVYFSFKYYNKTGVYPLLYVSGPLAHFSGTALLEQKDTISDLNSDVQKGDIVWMVNTLGFGGYQPEVPDNWQKIEEKGNDDVYNRSWIIATKYLIE